MPYVDRRPDGQQIQPKEFGNWGNSMIILFPFGLVPTGITTGILLVDSSPAAWPAHIDSPFTVCNPDADVPTQSNW